MCKLYGYARVSTLKQKLERQIDNIKAEFPEAIIVTDKYTGKSIDRPSFTRLLKNLKSGDTVVFDSVSRMSRNAQEGIDLYFELYNKGINLVFLAERHIDTEAYKQALSAAGINVEQSDGTAEGDLINEVLSALNKFMKAKASQDITKAFDAAQKEVEEKKRATIGGLEQARLRGVKLGREQGRKYETKKSVAMKQSIREMSKDFDGSMTDKRVMETLKLARNTYYKYKAELKEEQGA